MANLRIIYNNAADRATVTTSPTAIATLPASNLTTEKKSKVCRIAATTIAITAIWTTAEILSGVALPFCNLTSTATLRVRAYTLDTDSTPVYDSGINLAVGYANLSNFDWGAVPLGVNAYSYSGGSYGMCWFNSYVSVKKIIIDVVDTANTAGYLEFARLVTGSAWSPTFNTSFGIPVNYVDTSTHERAESGDLATTRGIRYKQISFDLSWLNVSDRQRFSEIMKGNGIPRPIFISIFPSDTDKEKEQTYQIYGKLSQISALSHQIYTMYSSSIDIQEI